VTQAADLKAFEEFQGRAFRTALWLWMAALAISLIVYRAWSPTLGGILIGGAASLGAFRYKVWTLRRLGNEPTAQRARRLPLLDAGRYLVLGAGLALAAWLAAATDESGYLIAAAATAFLANVAIIVQAVLESRHRAGN
jgi:hypothetical protein